MGSFLQRTLNVTALWEWHRGFWAGTMAAFCRAPQCKMTGQQPAAQTFGALQTAFRNASPFQGLDLDTLEGFNFHKVLNTHALKNRALETCPEQSLAWCLFQSVMLRIVSQMWPKTKALKEAFSLSSLSHLSVLNPSPPLFLTLLEHCRILMQLDLRCK